MPLRKFCEKSMGMIVRAPTHPHAERKEDPVWRGFDWCGISNLLVGSIPSMPLAVGHWCIDHDGKCIRQDWLYTMPSIFSEIISKRSGLL